MDMGVMTWMLCGNLLPPFAEASESPESTTRQVRWPDTQNLSSILTQGFCVADHGTVGFDHWAGNEDTGSRLEPHVVCYHLLF
jgi:hypothetical protein